MFNFDLYRIIEAERQREVERAIRHRRLVELLAIRPTLETDDEATPGSRDPRTDAPGARAFGPAR